MSRNPLPSKDCAAVTPIRTSTSGCTAASSAISHGRDVQARAVDTGLFERSVQQPARRADERRSGAVLLIAGLLPDEHQVRTPRPVPEHDLCRTAVQIASPAALRGVGEHGEIVAVRYELRGGGPFRHREGIPAPAANTPHPGRRLN